MNENYYDILGVPQDATPEEIKKAYRDLAKSNNINEQIGLLNKYKDLGDQTLEKTIQDQIDLKTETMKGINKAYSTLSDPRMRQEYDHKLQEDEKDPEPLIALDPTFLNFGKVEQGKSASKIFQIINTGGPASAIHIDWDSEPNWGKLTITPNPDADNSFPISIDINVNTRFTPFDSYQASILVAVDEVSYTLPVTLTVTPRFVPKPVTPTPIPPSVPSVTSTHSISPASPKVSIGKVILSFYLWQFWLIGIPIGYYMIKNGSLTKKEFLYGLLVNLCVYLLLGVLGIIIQTTSAQQNYHTPLPVQPITEVALQYTETPSVINASVSDFSWNRLDGNKASADECAKMNSNKNSACTYGLYELLNNSHYVAKFTFQSACYDTPTGTTKTLEPNGVMTIKCIEFQEFYQSLSNNYVGNVVCGEITINTKVIGTVCTDPY